jgi:hypothetical protein
MSVKRKNTDQFFFNENWDDAEDNFVSIGVFQLLITI